MKFTTNSALLLKKLVVLNSVINSNNSIPILDCFLFEINKNDLKITSSDLETTLKTNVEVASDSIGSVAVPAAILVEMLKNFTDQSIDFDFEANNILKISSLFGEYNIAYYDAEMYPKEVEFPDTSTAKIPSKVLLTGISKTLFATGTDDLRPVLSGVLFELKSTHLNIVATDAHKLVKFTRNDVNSEVESDFIVPKKPLTVLKNVLNGPDEEVEIKYNQSNASFTIENYSLSCRLVDGKYPNYEVVIPKNNPNKMIVNRTQFLNSLKCVSIFSSKQTHQARLNIKGNSLHISAEDVDYSNKADEVLTCNYEGDDIEIGFNSKFLIEILNNLLTENVLMETSQPSRAGILTPINSDNGDEEILMLVMPSMIK
jgi:DNA polymerase-3 subunit beta